MTIAEHTRDEALRILDGFQTIVESEAIAHGWYITDDVQNPELKAKGALCNGQRMCAIGSLWVASGEYRRLPNGTIRLTGTQSQRDYIATRPALKLVYEVLDEVSREYVEDHRIFLPKAGWEGWLEVLFESGFTKLGLRDLNDPPAVTQGEREILLSLIQSAREEIQDEY